MKKIILMFMLMTLLWSCKTDNLIHLKSDLANATLVGKVISEEGLPLEGVTVKLGDMQETVTDINGKFLFNYLLLGKHKVTFSKKDYTPYEYNFVYNLKNRKLPPLNIKLNSFNYLMKKGFYVLKEGRLEDTEDILQQLSTIDNKAESYLYFKACVQYNKEKYEDAKTIIEQLRNDQLDNIYYQLTLTEIYKKLELFEKEARLCYFIGITNPDEYVEFLKRSAMIYATQLENKEKATAIMKEYSAILEASTQKISENQ